MAEQDVPEASPEWAEDAEQHFQEPLLVFAAPRFQSGLSPSGLCRLPVQVRNIFPDYSIT